MKKILAFTVFFFLMLLWFFPAYSQELVVFKNDTALLVRKHVEKGGFIYLSLSEGEMAVPKDRVKEIKKTDGSVAMPLPEGSEKPEASGKAAAPRGSADRANKKGFRSPLGLKEPKPRLPNAGGKPDSSGGDESDDDSADDGTDDEGGDTNESDRQPQNPPPRIPAKMLPQIGQSVPTVLQKH
jgi:hypothetical protein